MPTETHPVLASRSQLPYGIALPIASEGKSCTLTRSGRPFGRHSAPPLAKLPAFSFFLASTEMTGWPASRNSRACRAM